jgi:hypothetical protein
VSKSHDFSAGGHEEENEGNIWYDRQNNKERKELVRARWCPEKNAGKLLLYYMVLQPRGQPTLYSLP